MSIKIDMKNNVKEKIWAVMMFSWGLIMLFLVPTWQTPDEYTHLELIGNSINNNQFAENLKESVGIESGKVIFNPAEKIDRHEQQEALTKQPEYTRTEMMPHGVTLSALKHLPAMAGMFIAIVFGLPAYWVLQLGEIFALLFYTFLCYEALKILPIKKGLMSMIMLMPMALQQAGSIGYDAVVIPLCFFFICYILNLKFEKKEITLKDLLLILVCLGIITFIKIPYVFLGGLILLLPLEKIHIKIGKYEINKELIKKWRVPLISICFILVVIASYIFRDNRWIQIIYGVTVEWRRTLYLFWATFETWAEYLFTASVGNFGWLDTPVAFGYAVIVYAILILFSFANGDNGTKCKLKSKDMIIIWGTGLILVIFTMLSMVNHTIMMNLYGAENIDATYNIRTALYQIPYIGGLQGRYFLPFIALFFLPIPQVKVVNKRKEALFIIMFEFVSIIYIVWLLLNRFWIG